MQRETGPTRGRGGGGRLITSMTGKQFPHILTRAPGTGQSGIAALRGRGDELAERHTDLSRRVLLDVVDALQLTLLDLASCG